MSRNNTGNPIDSKAFADFEDNVKNLDQAANSSADTFQDRLGKSRLTWAGIVNAGSGDPAIAVDAAARAEAAASSVEQNAEQIAQDAAQQAVDNVVIAVDGAVGRAEGAADRAEAASDAAFVNADVYPTVAEGRTAVANGEQFQVVEVDEIVRYRRDSASTQTEMARYPSSSYVKNGLSTVASREYGELIGKIELVNLWIGDTAHWVSDGRLSYLIPVLPGETYEVVSPRNDTLVLPVASASVSVGDHIPYVGRRVSVSQLSKMQFTISDDEYFLWVAGERTGYEHLLSIKRVGPRFEDKLGLLEEIDGVDIGLQGFSGLGSTVPEVEFVEQLSVVSRVQEFASGVNRDTYQLFLNKGDVLAFEYIKLEGTTLWMWEDSDKFPLLSHASGTLEQNQIRSHTYSAYQDMTVRITSPVVETITVNGQVPNDIVSIGKWMGWAVLGEMETNIGRRTRAFDVKQGDVLVVTETPYWGAPVTLLRPGTTAYAPLTYCPHAIPPKTRFTYEVEQDGSLLLGGSENARFFIRRGGSQYDIYGTLKTLGVMTSDLSRVSSVLSLGEPSTIFLTVRNYIVKTEMVGGVEYIATSADLGKTWRRMENTLGDITHAHIFSDGTLMLATTGAIYWSEDYETLNSTTVLDEDGNPVDGYTGDFYSIKLGDKVTYVDGVEMYTWGDYILEGPDVYIWYTSDRGRTVKAAAKFGKTLMGGITRRVRHVHQVAYNRHNGKFYVATGDHNGNGVVGGECMLLEGTYDSENDSWEWGFIAWGNDFKWLNISFDEYYTYLTTDITDAAEKAKNGFYRVPTDLIHDRSKYEQIWATPVDELGDAAMARITKDPNGNILMTPDLNGAGRAWVSVGGLEFKFVTISPSLFILHTTGPNYNGDVYAVASDRAGVWNRILNKPTYNLTTALRNMGVGFMRGISMLDGQVTIAD